MNKGYRLMVMILLTAFLVSCNVLGETPDSAEVPISVSEEPVSVPALEELARGSKATASALLLTELPQSAVDGDLQTQWGSGKGSPQWIQLELSDHATVHKIRLTVGQYPDGETTHQIWVALLHRP